MDDLEDETGGLLNIEFSDEDEDDKKFAKRALRTGQTEQDFQAIKRDYRAKVENGNIYKAVALPLLPGANKQHIQEILHAVEELYFFRRYQEAIDFVAKVLQNGGSDVLDDDTRRLLAINEAKCVKKLSIQSAE